MSDNSTTCAISDSNRRQGVALPTALVSVSNGIHKSEVRVLFDQGSQRSFILKSLVNQLQLEPVGSAVLDIDGFDSSSNNGQYDIVSVNFHTATNEVIPIKVTVVDKLPNRVSMPGFQEAVRLIKAKGMVPADPANTSVFSDVSILIGADEYYSFVYDENKIADFHVIPSKLGHLISGRLPMSGDNAVSANAITVLRVAVDESENINDNMQKIWSMDSIGICSPEKYDDHKTAIDNFQNSLEFSDNKYTVRLPWRENAPELPNNFELAKKRLFSNIKSLRQKSMLDTYDKLIENQLKNDFIERVHDVDERHDSSHYLPHHGVLRDSSTTPLRIVYDCSARIAKSKASLNDCLYSGPPLINDLVSILINFRSDLFACVSDIEKAYLNVQLAECDRDYTRFLWINDINNPHSEIIVYRFKVVLFGATCSQFLLGACLKYHLERENTITAGIINDCLYVDNLICSMPNTDTLINFYYDAKSLMKNAGFNIREWVSNSSDLNNVLKDRNDFLDKCENSDIVRVLGVDWDLSKDVLSCNIKPIECSNDTKRTVLQKISKIFDPIGMLIPVVIRSRMFIQSLWKNDNDWDDLLNDEQTNTWNSIAKDLFLCRKFCLDRHLDLDKNIELHAFSDASSKGYGAVIYAVQGHSSKFIIAKGKVTPVKSPSIPQLELTGVNLAARLLKFVRSALQGKYNITNCCMWTDSQIVIAWLNSSKLTIPYVRSRVNDIKSLAPGANVYYVNTKENPSDMISRGVTAKEMLSSHLWAFGPNWLCDKCNWPEQVLCNAVVDVPPPEDKVVKISEFFSRFSSYYRMLRVLLLIFKFLCKCKYSIGKNNSHFSIESVPSLHATELIAIKLLQAEYFSEIVAYFDNGKVGKTPFLVRKLNLDMSDGILRCVGRLQYSDVDFSTKYPILLPSRCHFTNLLIQSIHERCMHAGVNHVLGIMRERWWVPSARQRIKSVLHRCVICRRYDAKPYLKPSFPPFPSYRVSEMKPFSVVGVDYTGSLTVIEKGQYNKVYICLFTCTVTRAVHLELVEDCTATSFIRAFRRFVGRRSCPKLIISDNASTFKCSYDILQHIFGSNFVKDYLNKEKVNWHFIPARAPWQGGFYERLIGLTKNALKKTLGRAYVSYVELNTVLIEIEAILNDRPISHSSDNENDLCPLSPSCLIYGYRLTSLPDEHIDLSALDDPSLYDKEILNKRELYCRTLISNFWKRWVNDYLLALRERENCTRKTNNVSNVQVGDIVFIHDEGPRQMWKLGRIIELFPSRDGTLRSVKLRTVAGEVTRPIVKLYPLEINIPLTEIKEINIPERSESRRPPKRQAAINAMDKIRIV